MSRRARTSGHGRGALVVSWMCVLAALPARGEEPPLRPAARDTTSGAETSGAVLPRVIRILAAHYALPENEISADTDLVRDLGSDATDVAEAALVVYEAFGMLPPAGRPPTTVAGLAAQVGAARGTGVQQSARAESLALCIVHYATDRAVEDVNDPHHAYGGERGPLAYGACRVTIPVATHRPGRLEGPSLPIFSRWNAGKHILLEAVQPLPPAAFWDSVGAAARTGDVLLFVHGFNTSFEKAARRTAQMAYDLAFPGASVLFSWPSDGSMTRYVADREDAEWSAYDLAAVLETLAAERPSGRVHVVAHSMGNQVLAHALLEVSRRRPPGSEPLLHNVILAAPDVDAQLFDERLAPQIRHLARRWTLYVSDKDVALDASTLLGARRLGMPLPVIDGMETVDATGLEVTPWNPPEFHDYYATKLKLLTDLVAVLRGVPAAERALEARRKGAATYWVLR